MPPVRFPWTGRAGVAVEVEKVSVCKCVLRTFRHTSQARTQHPWLDLSQVSHQGEAGTK